MHHLDAQSPVNFPLSYFAAAEISPAKNLISCSFVLSAKGQTEDENFQRLDQQNKLFQRRMKVKNDFYVKIFRRRRRNHGVENGLETSQSVMTPTCDDDAETNYFTTNDWAKILSHIMKCMNLEQFEEVGIRIFF